MNLRHLDARRCRKANHCREAAIFSQNLSQIQPLAENGRILLTLAVSEIQPLQESPRQTKPKKGPKRKVHEFRPFL